MRDAGEHLIKWYTKNQRQLPWRVDKNPYPIWVAEIMLQQTRVETVIPYFNRWMAEFPNIETLAKAPRDEVLKLWEGLGYYRRAHAMHETANLLIHEYEGEFPHEIDKLIRLPGIGPYTASAIASFAFGQDVLTIDGNIKRVMSRWIDLELDPGSSEGEEILRAWATETMPLDHSAEYNQALMDIGASFCSVSNPACEACPLNKWCLAFKRGTQELRPIRSPKGPTPSHTAAAAILFRNDCVLIGRRPEGKLLGGLWEFPGGKQEPDESIEACLVREIEEELGITIEVGLKLGTFHHAYTHFKITVHAFFSTAIAGDPIPHDHTELAWVPPTELDQYPMGKVDRSIATELVRTLNKTDQP